jgi:hypothetical protein
VSPALAYLAFIATIALLWCAAVGVRIGQALKDIAPMTKTPDLDILRTSQAYEAREAETSARVARLFAAGSIKEPKQRPSVWRRLGQVVKP